MPGGAISFSSSSLATYAAKASSPSPVSIRSAQSRPAVWLSRLSTVMVAQPGQHRRSRVRRGARDQLRDRRPGHPGRPGGSTHAERAGLGGSPNCADVSRHVPNLRPSLGLNAEYHPERIIAGQAMRSPDGLRSSVREEPSERHLPRRLSARGCFWTNDADTQPCRRP